MVLKAGRVLNISDIHVDIEENREWLKRLSKSAYHQDCLIVAGDISDRLDRLKWAFEILLTKFSSVFFVPGNHELWVKSNQVINSLDKYFEILELCHEYGVHTKPERIQAINSHESVWVVPVFTWYQQPEEGESSLYIEQSHASDQTQHMWRDNFLVHWPEIEHVPFDAPNYFLELSCQQSEDYYQGNVITFSHFLPNKTVMFPTSEEKQWRQKMGFKNPHPEFNFSRVAGYSLIDPWIRKRGSRVHIYGHQHRNRTVELNGLTYVSYCLGYPKERQTQVIGNTAIHSPMTIWDQGQFLV